MAAPFSRTLRSLSTDDFRAPRMVWILAVIVLAGWMWWFFTAQIPTETAVDGRPREIKRASPAHQVWQSIQRTLKPAQ